MLGGIFDQLGQNTREARDQEVQKEQNAIQRRSALLTKFANELDPNSPTHAQDWAQLLEWAEHPFGNKPAAKGKQKGPGGSDPQEYRGHLAQVLAGLNKFAHEVGHGAKLVGEHIGPFYQAAREPQALDTQAIQRMVGSAEDRQKWDAAARLREVQEKLQTADLVARNLGLAKGSEEYKNFVAQQVTGKPLPKEEIIKLSPDQVAKDIAGNTVAEGKPKPSKSPTNNDLKETEFAKSVGKDVRSLTTKERLEARATKYGAGVGPGRSVSDVISSGATLSDQTIDNMAKAYLATGGKIKPNFGFSQKDPNRLKFWAKVGDLTASDPKWIQTWANFNAGTANLNQLTKIKGILGGLEDTFKLDIGNAREASKGVDRSSVALLNKGGQFLTIELFDHPELAKFRVAILAAANQYAQVMNAGAGGASRVTVNAQDHARDIVNTFVSDGTIEATLDQMVKEADNKVTATNGQIEEQRKALTGGAGASGESTTPKPKPTTPTAKPKTAEEYLKGLGAQ